jgi:hypothetical protein
MTKFKNGDKVKIPTIGTACIRTSLEEIQESLADYKLDYLYVGDVWKDGEIGLMRGDGIVFEQDLYHERDLEHYAGYGKTLKVSDKVKVIGNQSNSAFKLHGRICTICEVGKDYYGLEEEIPLNIDFGGVHHHEVELVTEYNETFNPEAHSSLIIDFDKVETVYEAAEKFHPTGQLGSKYSTQETFVLGAKSNSARNYWFKIFQEEQKGQDKQPKN